LHIEKIGRLNFALLLIVPIFVEDSFKQTHYNDFAKVSNSFGDVTLN